VLLSRTVVIVDRNQSVNELYIPYSWLEKTAQKVEIVYAQDRDAAARTRGVAPAHPGDPEPQALHHGLP